MGKKHKKLKKLAELLEFENSFLTSKVEKVILENSRVKRELQVSNARIVELAQEIEIFCNYLDSFLNSNILNSDVDIMDFSDDNLKSFIDKVNQ